jgi:hypothetical protein
MQAEQVLINSNWFKLFHILNYKELYKEGEVTICATTKFKAFLLLQHLCKLLTL